MNRLLEKVAKVFSKSGSSAVTAQTIVMNPENINEMLAQLIQERNVSKIQSLMQNRDAIVDEAIKEYNPDKHEVMSRRDKDRQGKKPYISEKLPRSRQRYINEVELFFLLGNKVKWEKATDESNDDAFALYREYIDDMRFDTYLRQLKRLAGAETEAAIYFRCYEQDGQPYMTPLILARSLGYTLRPLFDRFGHMVVFGYGFYTLEGNKTVENFELHTPQMIYLFKKIGGAWIIDPQQTYTNKTGKINIVYVQQPKAWEGSQSRCNREEKIDSGIADTNNYFADPIAVATADVLQSLPDPDIPGGVIQKNNKDSVFEYANPPMASESQKNEREALNTSILFDSFTPDMSFEAMKGLGTLSGDAIERAMALGQMKRQNRMEIYDIAVDRMKNIILAIMMNVTHIGMADKLRTLKVKHEFSQPFSDDRFKLWDAVGNAVSSGIMSKETAVKMLAVTDNPNEEIARITQESTAQNIPQNIVENF